MANKYKKKPVVVEAIQFTRQSYDEVRRFTDNEACRLVVPRCIGGKAVCYIETLEGVMVATEGDYIIKGVRGEFYPCKPDIFKATYDSV